MPKLEPKFIQKELEAGELWPVYWIYGLEKMKVRELLKRFEQVISPSSHNYEKLDGADVDGAEILDAVRSLSLSFDGQAGMKFVVVRDAHLVKNTEALSELFGPKRPKGELDSVLILISKDLDGRKKFSKLLTEKAAVVPCEEVLENDREAWIGYLAKRKEITISPEVSSRLACLDPWSLDIVDQELEKYALSLMSGKDQAVEVFLGASGGQAGGTEAFLQAFFERNLKEALSLMTEFAANPDQTLPLLGLLGWNVRQLVLLASDRATGGRNAKLNPYLADRLKSWASRWSLSELGSLQAWLSRLDYQTKQTPLLPLATWAEGVEQFCVVK